MQYDQYYLQRGVRRYDQLTQPPMSPLTDFTLPWYSLVHYLPKTGLEIGPTYNDIIFQTSGAVRYIEHVLDLASNEGNPVWAKKTTATFVAAFRKKEQNFRRMGKLDQIFTNKEALLVENYAILQHLWVYRETPYTPRFRWLNVRNTLWSTVARLFEQSPTVNQFVFFTLPAVVPNLQQFQLAGERITRDTLAVFNSDEALDLLDLYQWAGPNRERSTLAALSAEALARINLVFTVGGYWTVVNLGTLNQWIKGEGIGPEAVLEKGKDPELMRKTVLAFFNRLLTVRSTAESTVAVKEHTATTPVETAVGEIGVTPALSVSNVLTSLGLDLPTHNKLETLEWAATVADTPTPTIDIAGLETGSSIVKTFWDLDKPPISINEIIQPYTTEITEPAGDTLGQYDLGVMLTAARYNEEGLISNAEFERFKELAGRYRELEFSPGRSVAETCVIKPEIINDVTPKTIPDNPTVIDKSFLSSTLSVFDSKYLKDVFHADLANVFVTPQRAGMALTAFARERTETIADDYETYTLAYTPVDGERGVYKIPIPVIQPDGTFRANGTKYYMKKQRVDVPIRKVAANKVALTSYYGKLFIWRSDKVKYDYNNWLLTQVDKRLHQQPAEFTEVRYGLGVRNTHIAPRGFTILGGRWLGFKHKNYEFVFDYAAREQYDRKLLKDPAVEFPIGWFYDGDRKIAMLIDRQNELYRADSHESLGSLESVLGIDVASKPLDAAELAVSNKRVPMGIVLCLRYGIDQLLKNLAVSPRRVPIGERVNAAPHEFVVRFKDQSLVIDTSNRLATLVLSGLESYRDAIASYAYDDYNQRDALLNVLDTVGVGARVARAIDDQFDLFLDHITRELLADLKEPTEFGPLLIRGCQLLLTDEYPDETDLNYQRLAGYERVAGAVYRELIPAIRAQRRRQQGRRGAIELKPTAIWQRLLSDGSIQQVEESTPVHNLKEQEAVTFGGDGGRGARTMPMSARAYHESDIGTISEATVDSSAVAINTSMVANPKFRNLRGLTERYDQKTDGAARLMSTSVLLAPGADRDDQTLESE